MKFVLKVINSIVLSALTSLSFANTSDEIRILVKYNDPRLSIKSVRNITTNATKTAANSIEPIAGKSYLLKFKPQKGVNRLALEQDIIKKLQANPKVKYVIKDRTGHMPKEPIATNQNNNNTDLDHYQQWNQFKRPGGIMLESYPGLNDGAWLYTTGISSSPVYIAVLDTGIALNENLILNLLFLNYATIPWGWNFSENNNNVLDSGIGSSYHGTHVTGIIAAYGEVKGVGENLHIIPIKVSGDNGMFYESNVINAIYWAVGDKVPNTPSNGVSARVINMSFGLDIREGEKKNECDPILQEAIDHARQAGAVVVVAAGNANKNNDFSAPALCEGTIRVTSTDPKGLRAYYSNYGREATLAAPGGDKSIGENGGILSTVNSDGGIAGSGYAFKQGTNIAAPHVSGVAGLMFAITNQAITSEYVEGLLIVTTHEFGQSYNDNNSCIGPKGCGSGILDGEFAVNAAQEQYQVFYTAPHSNSHFNHQNNRFFGDSSSWIGVKHPRDNCLRKPYPYVSAGKDGKIYAYSNGKTYYLDTSKYQSCKVIGYNGVGCRY